MYLGLADVQLFGFWELFFAFDILIGKMLRAILLFSRSIRFQNRNFRVRLTGRNRLRRPNSYRSPTDELIQFKIWGVRKHLLQYPAKDALDIKKFAGDFRKPHLYYLAFSGVKKAQCLRDRLNVAQEVTNDALLIAAFANQSNQSK